jgi:hypothetical protein
LRPHCREGFEEITIQEETLLISNRSLLELLPEHCQDQQQVPQASAGLVVEADLVVDLVAGLGVNHSDKPVVQIESPIQDSLRSHLRGNLKGNLRGRISDRARDKVNQIVPLKDSMERGFNRSKSQ